MCPRCAEEPVVPVGNARNHPARLVAIEFRALITATLALCERGRYDHAKAPAARCLQVGSRKFGRAGPVRRGLPSTRISTSRFGRSKGYRCRVLRLIQPGLGVLQPFLQFLRISRAPPNRFLRTSSFAHSKESKARAAGRRMRMRTRYQAVDCASEKHLRPDPAASSHVVHVSGAGRASQHSQFRDLLPCIEGEPGNLLPSRTRPIPGSAQAPSQNACTCGAGQAGVNAWATKFPSRLEVAASSVP